MKTYLEVGAIHIQSWLLRTPGLRLMRGASLLLSEITDNQAVDSWLTSTYGSNPPMTSPEAGNIDGNLAIEVPPALHPQDVAVTLVRHLAEQAPGLEWEAWWATASSLAEAKSDRGRRAPGGGVLHSSPAPYDLPMIGQCACRNELARPAVRAADEDDDEFARRRLGPDCAARDRLHTHRRFVESGHWRVHTYEFDDIRHGWPKDFDDLALRGGLAENGPSPDALDRKDSRNHLATIVADGNAIGAFFSLLASPPAGVDIAALTAHASTTLDEAAEKALRAAAREVSEPGWTTMVVIPHFLGGDDLFLSVPAPVAWRFATRLAITYADEAKTLLAHLPTSGAAYRAQLEAAIEAMSLGVGMCFAHASHPIADCHEAADRALDVAKRAGRGAAAYLGWVDLTAGQAEHVFTVSAHTIAEELTGVVPEPDVFGLSRSGRAQLGNLLRDSTDANGREREQEVAQWARRVQWARPRPTPRAELPALLSRARWFPQGASAVEEVHR